MAYVHFSLKMERFMNRYGFGCNGSRLKKISVSDFHPKSNSESMILGSNSAFINQHAAPL
jgi:hypothetical protein